MSRSWHYKSGDWNALCDVCGKKHKASTMKQRWDGFMVCPEDFETRQPLDFIKVRKEQISVPWVRSQTEDVFVVPNEEFLYVEGNYVDYGYFEELI
jgi:hypothetical protein